MVLPTRPFPFIPERSSSEASVVRDSSLEDVQVGWCNVFTWLLINWHSVVAKVMFLGE